MRNRVTADGLLEKYKSLARWMDKEARKHLAGDSRQYIYQRDLWNPLLVLQVLQDLQFRKKKKIFWHIQQNDRDFDTATFYAEWAE